MDGSTNGDHTDLRSWLFRQEVRIVKFCPEDFSFGTPRMTPDSHDGNGFDVLDGNARSLAEDGTDWTDGMVKAAYAMRDLALHEGVELAVLMDMSGAWQHRDLFRLPLCHGQGLPERSRRCRCRIDPGRYSSHLPTG
ncbi:MAG: hypothetical protein IPO60_08185 [Flavobacteriales bacterium]|nr:hypothetical protein [Flavobacteriales bacterium]